MWLQHLFLPAIRLFTTLCAAREKVKLKSSDVFDWDEYEEILYKGLHEAILRFSKKHTSEHFYGCCIDCNAEYGQVLLHFNSIEWLKNRVETERWDVGGWEGYFDVIGELEKEDHFFSQIWNTNEEYILDKMFPEEDEWDEEDSPVEDFMVMVSKVANRLGVSEAVKALNRTEDFIIVAADHDEEIDEGRTRMQRVASVKRKFNIRLLYDI